MKNVHIAESIARWASVGRVLMAASQPSAAFGGAGSLENCATSALSAAIGVGTGAPSRSAWRDAWTFANDAHRSATVRPDGRASDASNTFPSSFTRGRPLSDCGDWSWTLKVWAVDNLRTGDCDELTLVPSLVARR